MKVILSVDSVKFPLTGIGRYTYELAQQLQLQPSFELLLFANGQIVRELPAHGSEEKDHTIKSNLTGLLKSRLRKSNIAVKTYQMINDIRSKSTLQLHEHSIFHGPNFYLPKFSGSSVATFHDLSVFTHSQYHPSERVRFMKRELNFTLQRASVLITDSEYTKRELANYFGYPLEKIHAIPLANSEQFKPRVRVESNAVLSKYGLSHGNYTLFAGTIEPRKNIDGLLDAFALLPEATRQQYPLVLIGFHGWQSDKIHARIENAVAAGWAYYFGYVSNDDIPYLFSGARLFVFPSHYEGFGLPVLEAMASGVPVVCSNTSSLPEVVGDAALMCESTDIDSLHQHIVRGVEDEHWRALAIQNGLNQSKQFSWQRCAAETIAVYRSLNARNPS